MFKPIDILLLIGLLLIAYNPEFNLFSHEDKCIDIRCDDRRDFNYLKN